MQKKIILSSLIVFSFLISCAQRFNKQDLHQMRLQEDSLKIFSRKIINSINASDRFTADSSFTKTFVRALKTSHSFYYPFDSLDAISKLYAPDSSFRIFTWQLVIDENIIRQHGAIQMKTDDGSLKLFPLIDKSDNITNLQDTVTSNRAWVGAVYYRILMNSHAGKKVYTLLGYDEDNIRCNRKFIEFLHFENDEPVFGGDYFDFSADSTKLPVIGRHVMEFKKEAGPRLTFDTDMNMIIMEHLVSESNEPRKEWTLVGDGDYEGFKWSDGKWKYIPKVFNMVTPEGKAPEPKPILDNQSENKLRTRD